MVHRNEPLLQDVLLPHELDWLHLQPHFPTAVTQVTFHTQPWPMQGLAAPEAPAAAALSMATDTRWISP